MFEFLFDIKPDAGNVCPTTRLAYLISERGNKVYYTDTSDSVFTTGLLRKGIGRIIYPHDLRRSYGIHGGAPWLDNEYTVFGEVVEGMKVVEAIQKIKTNAQDVPLKEVRIVKAYVKE